jgi:hypothetical protein
MSKASEMSAPPAKREPSEQGPSQVVVVPTRTHTVWWMLTVVMAVLATAVVMRWDQSVSATAMAQMGGRMDGPAAGARGIYAFPGPISSKTYGLWMVDVDSGTLWCYEMEKVRDSGYQLRLIGARSWLFDRYLEEFNNADPTPSQVATVVQQQQLHRERRGTAMNGPAEAASDREAASIELPETADSGAAE